VINPIPATPAPTSNGPICVGQTLNLSTTAVAGATYSWTGPDNFTSSLQNPGIPGATGAASGTYSLTVTVNGCTSPAGTVVVLVSSNPPSPSVSSNSPVCTGQTLMLSADTIAGATYTWTGPNSFSSTLQNPTISPATLSAAGTYTVVVFNGCASAPATVSVTINPTPATPNPNSNSPVCEGSTIALTVAFTPGATYSWTGPNGFTASSANASVPNATSVEAGTYSLTITVNGCTSNAGTELVVVDPTPVVSAGSSQTVCANNAVVALGATSTTGSGNWTTSGTGVFLPAANILNPTYTPGAADTAAGSVTLTFTSAANGACAAANDQITITFTDAPVANAGADQTVCANNANVNLNGSVTIAGGGNWTTNGTGTFSPSSNTLNATYTPDAADTAAGTVTLYLTTTQNGGCLAAIDSMIVTITDAPVVDAGATVFRCSNNPNGQLNGSSTTGSGTWTTSGTGTFNPNANTLNATYIPSAADVTSGSVFFTLTSTANGLCTAVADTVSIIYTQPPVVAAGSDITVCANALNVPLSGTSSTNNGTWTTSGSGTFSPNGLNANYIPSAADTAAGTVTLTLTSTNNGGCLAVTDQLVLTITDAPLALAGADITVCSNNANVNLNGTIAVATGGVWSTNGTGTFSPSASDLNATYTPTANDTAAGMITIYLTTTGNGLCNPTVDSLLVTFTDAPYVTAGDTILTCISSPDTPLNGTSTTGSGIWTTLGSGTFSPNNATLNATYIPSTADTTAGSVLLVLTSANNGTCLSEDDTVLIIFAPVPAVTTTPDQTVCANNAVVLVGATSTTGTGTWSTSGSGTFTPSNTDLNPTYTPSAADTAAGSVTLTFTSTNGCTPIASTITLTITDAPVVNAGPDLFTCANNPNAFISASVSGGTTTGVWTTSGGGFFSPSNTDLNPTYLPDAGDIAAGTVTLVLTSTGNGLCLAESDTVLLTITPPPTATAGADLVACANNPVALGGTIAGGNGTGIWTTPNGSGTFTPSATDLNASYTPTNADTLASPVMVILTSTNNGGCLAASDTLFILVNPGPEVTAGPDQTVCANNATVALSGTVYLASGIVWSTSGDGTFTPDSVSLNAIYTPGVLDTTNGSVTLSISSTGNGLCSPATDSMIITITDAPVVNAGPNQSICTGITTAVLNGSLSGGATSAVWTTTGTGTFSPDDSTLNASYNITPADTLAGSVTLYLTSTNNGLCFAVTDSVVLTITPMPMALAGNDTAMCANESITLNGTILGGTGTGVWTTTGDGTFTPNDSTLNAVYTPGPLDTASGTVTFILNATNSCLPESDTLVINILSAPIVNAGNAALICAGENVPLGGSVANTTGGTWSTSGDGMFTPNAAALNATYIPGPADIAAGTVTVTLTADSTGFCASVSDAINITINSKPVAAFYFANNCEASATLFADSSTNVNGAITAWNWNFGSASDTAQHPSYTFPSIGTQTVTLIVSTAAGCSDTLTQTLVVNPAPVAYFGSDTACPLDAMYYDSSFIAQGAIVSWNWNFGDSTTSNLQNPVHSYADSGWYSVSLTVTSDSGCIAVFSDTTIIALCSDAVTDPVLPGAFTPNGDGHNDILYVRGGPLVEMELNVYNEWGNLVFTSDMQSVGWDGSYKGKPQPAGTYVWTLTGTTADGEPVNTHGSVTILR
jgi:gliding motility-associated-like protein